MNRTPMEARLPTIAESERFAARYLQAWQAKDPERIANLHAVDCLDLVELTEGPLVARKDTWIELEAAS